MAKIDFGGVIEDVVTSEEFPLEKANEVLKDEKIVILGYGVQGPAQALNLRDNGFEKRPEDMLYLMKGFSSYDNVRLCFDAAHAHIFSIIPLDRWALTLAPFIGELHLHNNSGNWDEHRGLDQGLIDFDGLLDLIAKETHHHPLITFEVHNDEEFWSSLEYLEKIWPWKEE